MCRPDTNSETSLALATSFLLLVYVMSLFNFIRHVRLEDDIAQDLRLIQVFVHSFGEFRLALSDYG